MSAASLPALLALCPQTWNTANRSTLSPVQGYPILGLSHEHCWLSLSVAQHPAKVPSNQALLPWSMHAPNLQDNYFIASFSLNSQCLLPHPYSQLASYITEKTGKPQKKTSPSSHSHIYPSVLAQTSTFPPSLGASCPGSWSRQTLPRAKWVPDPLTVSSI